MKYVLIAPIVSALFILSILLGCITALWSPSWANFQKGGRLLPRLLKYHTWL